ncbi:MAG: prephenate dehydrogenase, partial [Clostridia bacterium]|nr:prephenate dehydrogenase [Clostridia bacterium]
MKLNKNQDTRILIIGLGLMGGSYARALHARGYHISAITKEQNSIDFALAKGFIDEGFIYPQEQIIQQADIIIFALYPHTFIEWLEENQHLLRPGTILTDVTGVKGSIVYQIQDLLRDDVEFIAAHPMAGREVYGVENSDDKIFQNANYIVTPTQKNTQHAIELCKELGKELGFARISCLSPEEHDDMIGFVSQLTHCIAVTLMTCSDCEQLVDYTGDSFRDLTRIAAINDE